MVERVEGFCTPADWHRAYNEINEFERELYDWGAVVVKFWVHIDKDEQLRRFNDRQNTPEKQWKITDEDWRNREKWDQHQIAVNDMLRYTSTDFAPWNIIESNDKKFARIKAITPILPPGTSSSPTTRSLPASRPSKRSSPLSRPVSDLTAGGAKRSRRPAALQTCTAPQKAPEGGTCTRCAEQLKNRAPAPGTRCPWGGCSLYARCRLTPLPAAAPAAAVSFSPAGTAPPAPAKRRSSRCRCPRTR